MHRVASPTVSGFIGACWGLAPFPEWTLLCSLTLVTIIARALYIVVGSSTPVSELESVLLQRFSKAVHQAMLTIPYHSTDRIGPMSLGFLLWHLQSIVTGAGTLSTDEVDSDDSMMSTVCETLDPQA